MNDAPSRLRRSTSLLFVPAVVTVATSGIGVLGAASRAWVPVTVVVVVAMTFVAEQIAPYTAPWSRRGPTFGADAISAGVNEMLTAMGSWPLRSLRACSR